MLILLANYAETRSIGNDFQCKRLYRQDTMHGTRRAMCIVYNARRRVFINIYNLRT